MHVSEALRSLRQLRIGRRVLTGRFQSGERLTAESSLGSSCADGSGGGWPLMVASWETFAFTAELFSLRMLECTTRIDGAILESASLRSLQLRSLPTNARTRVCHSTIPLTRQRFEEHSVLIEPGCTP